MDIAWDITFIIINASVLILCIVAFKNVKAKNLLDKAKSSENKGTKPKALYYLDKALEKSPQDINIISRKAVLLRDMGNYDEAIEYYNIALVLAQDANTLATINYHLAVLYCNLGKYNESKGRFDNAMSQENSSNDEFWNNLGILYYHLNDKSEALRCFDKALSINPQSMAKSNRASLLSEIQK